MAEPDAPDVVQLIGRASAGDRDAFAALYERFYRDVRRYIYFRVVNDHDADDLAAQVFVSASVAIERYEYRGRPFLVWLYTIARHAVVDFVRARRPVVSLDVLTSETPLELPDPRAAADLERRLDADALIQAMHQLSPDQRRTIALRFWHDLDTDEVAHRLGKRPGSVRALQMRALMNLRRVLAASA